MRNSIGLVTLALAVSACATPQTAGPKVGVDTVRAEELKQQRFALSQRLEEQRRVLSVHHRLSAANIEFCKVKTSSIGASFQTQADYDKDFKLAAAAAGIDEKPTIGVVLDDSPAAKAGLRAGDVIRSVGGAAIGDGSGGKRQLVRAIANSKSAPLSLEILRGGVVSTVSVSGEEICGYPIVIVNDPEINASADGKQISLPRGMLHFTQNDNELALIIGHEMAHNAMGHIQARQKNQALGMLGGAILDGLVMAGTGASSDTFMRAGGQIGAAMYSKEFESEADYVGLYFMARAGFDTKGVENFWRRFAAENPRGITYGTTHPTTAARYVTLAKAEEEIEQKRAAGLPLRPRMKSELEVAPVATVAPADPVTAEKPSLEPSPSTSPVVAAAP